MSRDALNVEKALAAPFDAGASLVELMVAGRSQYQLAIDQFAEATGEAVDESIRRIRLAELYLDHLKEAWRLNRRMLAVSECHDDAVSE